MRTANPGERALDLRYRRDLGLLDRLVLRGARRAVNRFAKSVISRAYERGLIGSFALHELSGIVDRSLWPERHAQTPTMEPAASTCPGLVDRFVGRRGRCVPYEGDSFAREFQGVCVGVRGILLQMRDQDDDVYEVWPDQFTPDP